ncbi:MULTISPECIES: hypothetical protein [unclassified Sphingomonas]|jgi:hypothetical protein|uniref:hypothetical protein n=1 Tax=unclassified Sphingomonas TaxID=196159 RepID=UPI000832585A|nr:MULTISPECIES: hypothetical protein [unclassified Sphingomonas]MCH4891796.1 hypothetical protein [Sphingomonas sp. SFZ2018-12]
MQVGLWIAAALSLALAVVAGVAERRRFNRRDPDRAGFMPWNLIQVMALLAAVVLAALAITGGLP